MCVRAIGCWLVGWPQVVWLLLDARRLALFQSTQNSMLYSAQCVAWSAAARRRQLARQVHQLVSRRVLRHIVWRQGVCGAVVGVGVVAERGCGVVIVFVYLLVG